jgi:hypothetical protein
MLKQDLILRSPVEKTIGSDNIQGIRFGAVLSRAGVGKTSFLIQIALIQLLKDQKVLHVSLEDSIEKINLRYSEGYTNLIDSIGYVDPNKAKLLWDDIHTHKVGISYNEASFDTGKIRDYLDSFKSVGMKAPSMMILDGIDFDQDNTKLLEELSELHKNFSISIWFAMQNHREEGLNDDGLPLQLATHEALFDKAVFLNPVDNKIQAVVLKDGERADVKFMLDPATMMAVE